MGTQTQVEYEGQFVEAETLDFETKDERWSQYELADGTILRVKQVLVSVSRLRDRFKANGEPIYVFKIGGLVDTDIPRALWRKTE